MPETSITTTPLPHPVFALLARYRAIFGAVWAARHELAGPARLADERAFLPAALSLQETPPHPAPGRTALLICALFSLALTWACFGELDVVAVSTGRIVVSDNSKLVPPLWAASLKPRPRTLGSMPISIKPPRRNCRSKVKKFAPDWPNWQPNWRIVKLKRSLLAKSLPSCKPPCHWPVSAKLTFKP